MTLSRRSFGQTPTILAVEPADSDALDPLSALDRFAVRSVTEPLTADQIDAGVVCVVAAESGRSSVDPRAVSTADGVPWITVSETYDADEAAATAAAGGIYLPRSTISRASFVETVRDVARRGEANSATRLQTDAFEQLLDAHDGSPFVKNRTGQYVAAADDGELDPELLYGRTDADLASERDGASHVSERAHDRTQSVLDTGEPIVGAVEQHDTGESARWIERTILPWTDGAGELRGVVGWARDVSEWERERREMQRRIDQLERFTGFVTHDLRSPLQVADGYLELARAGDQAALDRVENANRRMQELISDFETLVGGAHDGDPHYTRLADMARDVWAVVARESSTLRIDLPDETIVNAERSALRPILENLFTNAIDHGGSDVTVWLGALADGFYVADDGPGIPEAERAKVFEAGFTTAEDGTGTGLAIVADAADRLNWEVGVEASRAGGAKIALRNCMMATDPSRHAPADATYDLTDARDVGSVALAGSVSEDGDEWVVTGGGGDGERGGFYYVYTSVAGPISVRARLADFEAAGHDSEAGLTVRDDAGDGAPYGSVGRTPDDEVETCWRQTRSATPISQRLGSGVADARWLRLDRIDDSLTCYVSRDGRGWRTIDQRPLSLSDPITLGLAVHSGVARDRATAAFDNVSIRRIAPDEW
ncbi:PAS domain-containing protein [Halomicrobium mukohataei]|uniref:histidine kinase n=1 Tax=Halomicrobium mukohataei TaxID=57705 RepID=A0A847UBS0_9EURY|nr:ATP-binding protein [Halomicrobium mukohataei]NLV10529.1 PAS domain-containing protein [Halomicrobium mukohataei]